MLSTPLLLVLHEQLQGHFFQQLAWIKAPSESSLLFVWRDLISRQAPHSALVELVGGALVVLCTVCCATDARRGRRPSYQLLLCITLAPWVLPLLVSQIHPAFIGEQVAPTLFGLLLLFGRGIVLARGLWRLAGVLALAAMLAFNSKSVREMASIQLNEDWRAAVPYVLRHSTVRTLIVVTPATYRIPFDYYAGQLKPGLQEVSSKPPVDTPQHPWPRVSTVWLIVVPYWDPAAPAAGYATLAPPLPLGWPSRRLRLTEFHAFASINLYRFSSR